MSPFSDGVWEPILNAIQTNLKPIFSPGIAPVFHKNYKISHIFLKDLESIFDSNDSDQGQLLEQYRQADITKKFKSKVERIDIFPSATPRSSVFS